MLDGADAKKDAPRTGKLSRHKNMKRKGVVQGVAVLTLYVQHHFFNRHMAMCIPGHFFNRHFFNKHMAKCISGKGRSFPYSWVGWAGLIWADLEAQIKPLLWQSLHVCRHHKAGEQSLFGRQPVGGANHSCIERNA